MLGKKNRLTDAKDFKTVQKEGKVFQFSSFGISLLNRNDGNPTRVGFIVSTKIAKDAVDRNRFKRAMSESVRTSLSSLKEGFDIVFLAKQSIVKTPTDIVMKEVKKALSEIGLQK